MKKIKKFIIVFLVTIYCIGMTKIDVYAAGMSVSASTSQVTIGSSFKVTVSATDCAAFEISAKASNGAVSGGSASLDTEGGSGAKSTSFTVTPSQTGTCSVTVTAVYASYSGSTSDIKFSKTVSVTVNQKKVASSTEPPQSSETTKPVTDNLSKEKALSSLTVSEGTLSPEFNPTTTQYTLNVASDKTKVSISAKAKDSKATISGAGEKTLDIGRNKFDVKCTAENGSSQIYTIVVNVDESPTEFVEFGNQKYGVVKNIKGVKIPNSFDETTTKMNDKDVIAWYSKLLKLTICYLSNESGEKGFYIVEDGKVMSAYQLINIGGKNYVALSIPDNLKDREGFTMKEVVIQETTLNGWIYNDEVMKSYIQVYLINEAGDKHIYDYELSENQLQIYTEQTHQSEGINIFMITTGIFVVTSAGLLYLYLNFKKKSISAIKDYYQNKQ